MTTVRSLAEFVTVALLAAALHAQAPGPTVTIGLAAPILPQAQLAGQVQNGIAGPGSANSWLIGALLMNANGSSAASVEGSLWSTYLRLFSLRAHASCSPIGGASAAATTNLAEVLLHVSNPVPIAVRLRLERTVLASAGSATPLQRVDIGNDGIYDLTELQPSGSSATFLVGPQGIAIRLATQATAVGQQFVDGLMDVWLEPDASINVTEDASGCSSGGVLVVTPSFQGGIDLFAGPFGIGDLMVGVLGTSLQPVLLPSSGAGCLLLPAPELVVWLPEATTVNVPISAAAHPAVLHAQAVTLLGSGGGVFAGAFATTRAFRIDLL